MIMKTIVIIIVGWATVSLMVDGLTGWGDKGELKKSFIGGFVAILFIALIYVLIDKIGN